MSVVKQQIKEACDAFDSFCVKLGVWEEER